MKLSVFVASLLFTTCFAFTAAAEERPSSRHRAGWGIGLTVNGTTSMVAGGAFLVSSLESCAEGLEGFGCSVGNVIDRIAGIALLATGGVKTAIGIPLVVTGSMERDSYATPMIGFGPGSMSLRVAF